MDLKNPPTASRWILQFSAQDCLFRLQAALAWQVAIELEVRADHDRLVRRNSDRKDNVGDSIETRTAAGLRHDPIQISGVETRQRHCGGARLSRISCWPGRAWDIHASQVVAISVEQIYRDIGGRRAAVVNVKVRTRTAGSVGKMSGCTNP